VTQLQAISFGAKLLGHYLIKLLSLILNKSV